ncbi:hypothetical protein [Erythrobacter sp. R86502]|uniref:hypothetical protein n=1 Tax=Erythrobacter sp. R86502 TaxID=3093846 RepID=UPI0036D258B3
MYKTVFQNSKVALAFAAMTVCSAVSMVGTSDDGGMLTSAVKLIELQRDSSAESAQRMDDSSRESGPAAEPAVFGDYGSMPDDAPPSGPASSRPAPSDINNPMLAPLSPTAIAPGRVQIGAPIDAGR